MSRQALLRVVQLVFVVMLLLGGLVPASAQVKSTVDPATGKKVVVDAAGHPHQIMVMRKVTPAERKTAAQRMKGRFSAAAQSRRIQSREVTK